MIARRCGELLRPVTLELGGKSAAIVLDDADLAAGRRISVRGDAAQQRPDVQPRNPGARTTRPTTTRSSKSSAASLARSQVGDSLDPATQVGPVASARQRERIEGYIEKGRAEGGGSSPGGGRPPEQERGWFVQPTIFADVDNSAHDRTRGDLRAGARR